MYYCILLFIIYFVTYYYTIIYYNNYILLSVVSVLSIAFVLISKVAILTESYYIKIKTGRNKIKRASHYIAAFIPQIKSTK